MSVMAGIRSVHKSFAAVLLCDEPTSALGPELEQGPPGEGLDRARHERARAFVAKAL
ncbi:hypothetical protein SRB17_68070 [Streptomyces sp. RB17]|uniref:hypothetical protein n=1 Tax=Streptomyces sp. RB17 TaxID=2585197 RepID=UPI001294B9AB|nr:hypothetical protein [Streptomyces sp. RB17]MQY38793.1 hypothetical protein [Streptomyces sp. RB17]